MQLPRVVSRHLFTICILILSQASFAEEFEPFEHIKEITKRFVSQNIENNPEEKVEITVNPSNARIMLEKCNNEIQATFPPNSSLSQITNVELTCAGTPSWHTFIPVNVEIYSKIITAKRTITPKEIIREEDLDFSLHSTNHLYSGYYKDKKEVIGEISAGLIPAGAVLTKKNVIHPTMVHRNQVVSLIAESNAIVVSMQGVAQADGALNSVIKVFNPSSKRTIDAVVIGPDKAKAIA